MKFTQRDLDKIVGLAKERGVREMDTELTESELKAAGALFCLRRFTYQGVFLNPRKRK